MSREEPACRRDPRVIELADALKALSEPNRLRIMCFLSKGERCVCHVEEELGISQQLTSHHLNVLKDAGFLTVRKEGTMSNYSIDVGFLKRVNETFMKYLDCSNVQSKEAQTACYRQGG